MQGNLKKIAWAASLTLGSFAASGASVAAPTQAAGPPTQSDPIIYVIKMPSYTQVELAFDLGDCPTKRQGQITIGTDEYAMGLLCGSSPRTFSNFRMNLDRPMYNGEYAEIIRDRLLQGRAEYQSVLADYQDRSPQVPARPVTVRSVRIVHIGSYVEYEALAARYAAAPSRSLPAAGGGAAASSGLSNDLAASIAQSFGRTGRIELGKRLGTSSVQGNVVLVDAKIQTQRYQFEVQPNARCTPLKSGQVRCSYSFRFTGSGSFAGAQVPPQTSPWQARTDVFTKTGNSYRSATLDAFMVELEAAGNSYGKGGSRGAQDDNAGPSGALQDIDGMMCDLGSKSYCR